MAHAPSGRVKYQGAIDPDLSLVADAELGGSGLESPERAERGAQMVDRLTAMGLDILDTRDHATLAQSHGFRANAERDTARKRFFEWKFYLADA
jgi:hypothetical protein